ncbi:helix-turn-helix transcriptional regulator [Geodermatophilus sp. URMC 62]|uniref:helix-turn-helix transcriptional regulator n=1 Tax=Geodermatophilus sp. URMC 62 TaxID=3423414 RepID=UPI00406C074F
MDAHADQVAAVAALAEPTRRRLYDHVVRQPEAVGRDEVAAAVGVPRATAAFHLDRLVDDGLLEVHYERRTGRSGPGAGRPAKLYRRSACSVAVSLPERRYDLAGELLAAAVVEAERSGERPGAVLNRRARARGRELGAAADGAGGRAAVLRVLEACGYEPRVDGGGVALANCPFHALAREHTDLVCGMNLQLLEGVLDGAGVGDLTARLRPVPGACCVRLEATGGPDGSGAPGD